ncbi:MAG: hypothetical protein K8R19_03405, partial [Methanosarcinales archaeon]|nr:hypothetical protein [Methanosarcinales archaeon]
MRMNATSMLILAIVTICIATATAEEQTPFVLDGYVNDSNGEPCNEPWVRVTNMNTSASWDAENSSTLNYYQLVLSSNDVSEGDILEIDASGCSQSKIMLETVSQDEINNGGLLDYNITLLALDTTPPVISNIENTEPTTD